MSFLEYDEIEKLVRRRAKEIAGVSNLVVKFSNRMKKMHASLLLAGDTSGYSS